MSPKGHKQTPEDLQDELTLLRAENEFLTEATENIHLLNAVAEQIALEPGPDQAFWVLMENLAAVKACDYLALFAIESGVRLIREYPDRTTPHGARRWHALPQDYSQINTRRILPIELDAAPPFWRNLTADLMLPDRTEQLLALPFFRQDRPYRVLILTAPDHTTPDSSGFLSILERIRDLIESRIRTNDMIAQIRTLNDQLRQKLEREREINADLREQFAAEVTFDSKTGLLSRYRVFPAFYRRGRQDRRSPLCGYESQHQSFCNGEPYAGPRCRRCDHSCYRTTDSARAALHRRVGTRRRRPLLDPAGDRARRGATVARDHDRTPDL